MKRKLILLAVSLIAMVALVGCGSKKSTESLTVINYGMYIDPDILDEFEEETGIEIKYEEALTPEEMYAKYSAGAIDYDLVCSSDYMIRRMIEAGELQKIDFSAMENIGNIGDEYWEVNKQVDETNEYSVPYFWGTVGILYDKTKVKEPIDSWDVLFNGEYAGDIIMQNSIRDSFYVAMKYLGYSLNSTNRDEIVEAQQLLIKQAPDVQAYLVDEVRDELVAGNAIMGIIYSGEAYAGIEANPDLEYVVPKEGSNLWIDCWAMPVTCKKQENAQKFLDYLCREDVATKNFEYVYYSSPNTKVIENLDDSLKGFVSINPGQEIIDRCEVNIQTDTELAEFYADLWKEIKAQ